MELKTNLNVTWRYTLEDLHQTEQDQPFYLLCDPKTRSITVLTEDEIDGKRCPFPIGTILPMFTEDNPSGVWTDTTWERFGDGRVLVGQDVSDADFDTLGKIGGEATHKLTVAEMPAHVHNTGYEVMRLNPGTTGRYAYTPSVSYGVTVGTAGGDQAHNNLQPYITCVFWRRVT